MLYALSWTAVVFLAASYWFQIVKIQQHREVRDISIAYHVFLAIGFGILIWTAWEENSLIFFVKQVVTFVPVVVIILQILWHRKDRWHDEEDPFCRKCNAEIEPQWKYCPYCSYWAKSEE